MDAVSQLAAHPHLPLLASVAGYGAFDGFSLKIWDVESRTLLCTLDERLDETLAVAFDPAGRQLASGSILNAVRVWDLDARACVRILQEHEDLVFCVTWNATGSLIASGSGDQTVRVWDAGTGACARVLTGHTSTVFALAAHPVEDLLASGSGDCTVRVWCWSSGECLRTLHGHTDFIRSLAASSSFLVSSAGDLTARVWSWSSEACLRVLESRTKPLSHQISLAWRASMLVELEDNGAVRVWDTSSPDPRRWRRAGALPCEGLSSSCVAVMVDGSVACVAADAHSVVAVWSKA